MAKTPTRHQPRDRNKTLRVVVNATERTDIQANAKAAGMTVSAFLRAAGTGAAPRSKLDHEAVAVLARMHADEGRMGGLLKLYLQEREPDRRTAERLLRDIDGVRSEIRTVLRRLST